ncbi:MAG TPA: M20/M25/M40 family metallo-hydrolase [Gaiellaceae bacterium]|nr:M20/M25/M40 family metallo-hydrolase [Gaiellaceae bacterium]
MRRIQVAAISLVAIVATMGLASASSASVQSCAVRNNNTHAKLQQCVTLEGARAHQAALQAIADANGSTRVSGSPGYDLSVEYAESVLEAAGYTVTVQPFQFQTFITLSPTILEQVSPTPSGPVANTILSYSGSGDVTAPVSVPSGDFRGCTAADFAGFPAGNIALISRGAPAGFPVACTFALKATNAYNAGASGVVIYNNATGVINGTLGNDFSLNLPVTSVTQAIGQQLAATPGLVMRLKADTFRGQATSYNVLAESSTGNPNNVVMVGAHLDSVNAGPGIQDNGSGSAAILEVAEQMAKVKPYNKVRFALWGAEESGLVGSSYYVNNLSQAERDKIALYLNFDMIGSPNHVFLVYDGDDSDATGAPAGPDGSAEIEKTFERFYTARGLPFKGTDFSGRSDYGPFIAAGVDIPAGGLFTGAEGIKTAAEVALWGGTAGVQYDPCYHLACDTFANINAAAFDVNTDAVAYSTLQYGMTTVDVNGVPGNPDFETFGPAVGPVAGGSSQGGLHDDHERLGD